MDWSTRLREHGNALSLGCLRSGIDFTYDGKPDLSVVMVFHDQFSLTLAALTSLRAGYFGKIQMILIDGGSTDETCHLSAYVHGAEILRFGANVGYLVGSNAGLVRVKADFVLFLNNDAFVFPNAVTNAVNHLKKYSDVGALGAMLLRPDGLVSETGCRIFEKMDICPLNRGNSPLSSSVRFAREVDYCSGAFLLCRSDILTEIGGFDTLFEPAYFEDADLCIRIKNRGLRVMYDPDVVVWHLGQGSVDHPRKAEIAFELSRVKFLKKYEDRPLTQSTHELISTRSNFRSDSAWWREKKNDKKRILFIENMLPIRMFGAGFVRSNDIVREMSDDDHLVTVFPMSNEVPISHARLSKDFSSKVELIYGGSAKTLSGHLKEREGYYDIIWVTRTHNLPWVLSSLNLKDTKIILDTESITSTREEKQALSEHLPFSLDTALKRELRFSYHCDHVVTTTKAEAELLLERGLRSVSVVGHTRVPTPLTNPFAERSGLLMVTAIHQANSPNLDGVVWFVEEILQLIEAQLGHETRVTLAGYVAPGVHLPTHRRLTVLGAVTDLSQLYATRRLFVAPTRFAAGAPYKIHEAASFGLPVVSTNLLCEQVGWQSGIELISADPENPTVFARTITTLYRDERVWTNLRKAALKRIYEENSVERYREAIRTAVKAVD